MLLLLQLSEDEGRIARSISERPHSLTMVFKNGTGRTVNMSPLTFKGALDSFRNLLIFMWVYISLPLSFIGAVLDYQEGVLSFGRILGLLFMCTCAGAITALVGWYVAFAGIIRRRSERERK
jgi:hypothetical protein